MTTILSTMASALGVSVPVFIAVAAITMIYVIYSLVTGKGMNVNLGKFQFGISFDPKAAEKEKEVKTVATTNQCTDCSKKDLYVEKAKAIVNNFSEEQNSIKKDLILQQMNYAEEKVSELRILLCKQYSRSISNKLNIGIISAKDHADYKFYRMLIYYILLSKVKDGVIKKGLKENHFLDLSNVEFEQYLQRKIDLIIDTISEGLDTYYSDGLLITREELFKINDQILLETKTIMRSIFENARNISENYNDKMLFNKSEMEKKLNDI
jgi:hypothetical protein